MKKITINKFFIFIYLMLISVEGGCSATVKELPPSSGLTKEKIIEGWKREPDKISRNAKDLKYSADEIWIYRYPDSDEDWFYFKNGILIRKEEKSYGSF